MQLVHGVKTLVGSLTVKMVKGGRVGKKQTDNRRFESVQKKSGERKDGGGEVKKVRMVKVDILYAIELSKSARYCKLTPAMPYV